MRSRALALALLPMLLACKPDLGPSDSLVTTTRILAVRAEPAEAEPGTGVTFIALVAGPDGTVTGAPIDWRFCSAPKPLTENNAVSTACLDAPSLTLLGVGPAIATTIPGDACRLFGPDTPPGGFRPRDPDVTGGYYQPLRAALPGPGGLAFELARVACNLGNANAASATAFAAAYVPNANPRLAALGGSVGGASLSQTGIPAGARVDFEASWAAADAETYAYFDLASQSVTTKREAMRVAWYASAGLFDSESTGRAEDDPATSTTDGWIAPTTPGIVHLWLVLRDSRGGVDFAGYDLAVVR